MNRGQIKKETPIHVKQENYQTVSYRSSNTNENKHIWSFNNRFWIPMYGSYGKISVTSTLVSFILKLVIVNHTIVFQIFLVDQESFMNNFDQPCKLGTPECDKNLYFFPFCHQVSPILRCLILLVSSANTLVVLDFSFHPS